MSELHEGDHRETETLLFLDIDGVLRTFQNLPDHWKQIFWRNYLTKLGRFDVVTQLIPEAKKAILANLVSEIGGRAKIVISSDWRKTLPEIVLAQAIGQPEVDKTPYIPRSIVNPLDWKSWYIEAINKRKLRIGQIEEYCRRYSGKIGRIIVVDDSSVVPLGYKIGDIRVEFIQPNSSMGLLTTHFSNK